MPGGHKAAWPHLKPIFQSIAAKTSSGDPCCDWVGDGGAGHFVKMVHNGIEYGDMQLICEAYDFMQTALGMDNEQMRATFADWDKGDLDSYLIEITADILGFKEDGGYVVDTILDRAGQKGTGKWTGTRLYILYHFGRLDRTIGSGSICRQDHLLYTGLYAHESCGRGISLGSPVRCHRTDVERRLYYSISISRRHQSRL